MSSVKIYTRFNRPAAVQVEFRFPSLTEQHHREDCDVNVILRNYMKTGVLPTSQKTPLFGDFSGTPQDYGDAVKLIEDANARFASLPSAIRERFGNDPLQLLRFLDNPANAEEAVKLGLLKGFSVPEGAGQSPEDASAKENKNPEGVTAEGGEAR